MTAFAATAVPRRDWLWAAVALIVGAGAAIVASIAPESALAVCVVAVGLAVAVLVLAQPQVGVVLIVASLPLDEYGRVLTRPVLVTVYQLLLILTLLGLAWRLIARRERYRFSALDLGMGAVLFAAVWSWPFSLDRATTTLGIIRLAFLWLFAAVMSHYLRDRKLADAAVFVLLATVAAASVLALAQYLIPGLPIGNVHVQVSMQGEQLSRVAALYSDPNNLAGFLSIGVTTAAAVLVHARRSRIIVPGLVVLLLSGTALLATFSRTGWIGAFFALVAVALTAPPRRRAALVVAGATLVVVAAIAAPGAIADRVASAFNYRRDMSVATRVYMAESSVEIARTNWQFGTGLGGFSRAYPAYRNRLALPYITKPHQVPLSFVAETGVAGLIAMLVLSGALVWTFFVSRRGPWTYLQAAALAGVVALLVQSLFQYYLYFEYVWFFAALGVATARMPKTAEEA